MSSPNTKYIRQLFEDVSSSDELSGFQDDSDQDPNYERSDDGNTSESTVSSQIVTLDMSSMQNIPTASDDDVSRQNTITVRDVWGPLISNNLNNNQFQFNPNNDIVGINPDLCDNMFDGTPYDYYNLFVDDEVVIFLVEETNRYANQNITRGSFQSTLRTWVPTDPQEMRGFLGIIMYMGLVQMTSIKHYWRKDDFFKTKIALTMTRSRFEILLCMFHCSNNDSQAATDGNRLYKIQSLVDLVVNNFQKWYIPESDVCIDESMVPFLGRLVFRQYIQNKRHRYGIKVFKLCAKDFYTIQYKIYSGKENDRPVTTDTPVSTKIVLELMTPFLDCGRTLFVDNWYSSVGLAEQLLQRNTHLVGTLNFRRKGNPKRVVEKKLKKGEIYAEMSDTNVLVLKWKDKRELLMISTKHDDSTKLVHARGGPILKPNVVIDYNNGKSFIDRSDQMASYANPLRRSLKWYRKIAFDLLISTSTTNALSLFQTVTTSRMSVSDFKENVFKMLVYKPSIERQPNVQNNKPSHILTKSKRGRCTVCYKNICKVEGRSVAQNKCPKPNTKCEECNLHYCLKCFFEYHSARLSKKVY